LSKRVAVVGAGPSGLVTVKELLTEGREPTCFERADSKADPSLRKSLPFHLRLPLLLIPELRRRGVVLGAAIVALLIPWEIANLAGSLAESAGLMSPGSAHAKATAHTRVR